MRNKIYGLLLMLPALLLSASIFAQVNEPSETFMRSNGKIYVVVAICITILTGLFLYVASIDRKIGRIEKENL
ncbi:CcmD family protein [Ferruginibacter sp.]|uniref:CcmD family protein n=1 Tax=Ferruginibacter sp. TaxID=1940288 RepID=UPI001989BCA3|nr:CcmD family protein [Ferruginibacter sp.]MBC7626908.1 CcmD family protein [Ferruginibacter sp.]